MTAKESINNMGTVQGHRSQHYHHILHRFFFISIVHLTQNVTPADIKAKFEDGILRVSIPKKDAQAVETKKTIAIEG